MWLFDLNEIGLRNYLLISKKRRRSVDKGLISFFIPFILLFQTQIHLYLYLPGPATHPLFVHASLLNLHYYYLIQIPQTLSSTAHCSFTNLQPKILQNCTWTVSICLLTANIDIPHGLLITSRFMITPLANHHPGFVHHAELRWERQSSR